jgi:hypothetical protein
VHLPSKSLIWTGDCLEVMGIHPLSLRHLSKQKNSLEAGILKISHAGYNKIHLSADLQHVIAENYNLQAKTKPIEMAKINKDLKQLHLSFVRSSFKSQWKQLLI